MPDIASLAAIAIALASFIYSVVTSREVRAMNRREHWWEQSNRISAHIEVTRRRRTYRTTGGITGSESILYEQLLRLRNTGRAPALDVDFRFALPAQDDEANLVGGLDQLQRPIAVIHPGESIDLHLVLSMADPVFGSMEVSWSDETGDHRKTSVLNL